MKIRYLWMLLLASSPCLASPAGVRSVYLNGIDISSARNQSLSHVDIKVDSNGDMYIVAPQYEVQQESTFVPLGKQGLSHSSPLEHRQPGPLVRKPQNPASESAEKLATPPETGDMLAPMDKSAAPEAQPATAAGRTPPDANQPPAGPGTQVQ